MKYLDQAAINYGKAIDAKPDEKYFLEPQKRIETAIAHYKQLDQEHDEAAAAPRPRLRLPRTIRPPSPASASAKGLTNAQVIAMVKSGIDDATVIQAIRGADAVNFDLTPAGQKTLTSSGVSPRVLAEMKTQAAKKPRCRAQGAEQHSGHRHGQGRHGRRHHHSGDQRRRCHRLRPEPRRPETLTSSGVSARVSGRNEGSIHEEAGSIHAAVAEK